MKISLFLLALAALPAAAEQPIGMVSAIDPAKECGIDGPADKNATTSLFVQASKTEQVKNGSFKLMPSEKPLYCQIAEQTALRKLGTELSKKWKGEKVGAGNTAKWEKYTKLYSEIYCANWNGQKEGKREWTEAEQTELREEYAKQVATYVAGAKTASERGDAVYTLVWVDLHGPKNCKEWLEGEKKLLEPALNAAIDAAKKK